MVTCQVPTGGSHSLAITACLERPHRFRWVRFVLTCCLHNGAQNQWPNNKMDWLPRAGDGFRILGYDIYRSWPDQITDRLSPLLYLLVLRIGPRPMKTGQVELKKARHRLKKLSPITHTALKFYVPRCRDIYFPFQKETKVFTFINLSLEFRTSNTRVPRACLFPSSGKREADSQNLLTINDHSFHTKHVNGHLSSNSVKEICMNSDHKSRRHTISTDWCYSSFSLTYQCLQTEITIN